MVRIEVYYEKIEVYYALPLNPQLWVSETAGLCPCFTIGRLTFEGEGLVGSGVTMHRPGLEPGNIRLLTCKVNH